MQVTPDHADSRWNDAIEIVRDHFEHGGTQVSYSRAPAEHMFLPFRCSPTLLFLLEGAFRMPLLNFADILLQFAIDFGSIGFESGVMRS